MSCRIFFSSHVTSQLSTGYFKSSVQCEGVVLLIGVYKWWEDRFTLHQSSHSIFNICMKNRHVPYVLDPMLSCSQWTTRTGKHIKDTFLRPVPQRRITEGKQTGCDPNSVTMVTWSLWNHKLSFVSMSSRCIDFAVCIMTHAGVNYFNTAHFVFWG